MKSLVFIFFGMKIANLWRQNEVANEVANAIGDSLRMTVFNLK